MSTLKEKWDALKNFMREETPKKYGVVFVLIFIAVILCEIFVFNYKWLNSAFDKEIAVAPRGSANVKVENDGDIYVNSESVELYFDNVNSEVKYLKFKPTEKDETVKADIAVAATDEANANFLAAPARTVISSVRQSQYIRLHFSGEVGMLKIVINGMNGRTIKSGDIALNTRVPLMFSWLRVIALLLILMALYILRPGSSVYKYKTNSNSIYQFIIAVSLVLVQAVLMWNMMHWNTAAISWSATLDHHQQYYKLVEAFKQGHFYLDDEVTDKLREIKNPYDTQLRDTLSGRNYHWDHAYYNGKYYVYFGVVPALMLYLPYNLITGGNLPNHVALYIYAILTMIGIMLLLWEVIKKWFKDTPFALYMILSVVFVAVAAFDYAVYKPCFYIVPPMAALMFGIFGLAFWLSAEHEEAKGTRLVPWRMAVGSSCVALTAGCRPQMLLVIVLGIMLFWKAVFKERQLFSKKSVKPTLALCVPFIIVAAGIMWYNFARFGSPFDFGANYNLTTNDMTHRGFVWGRTGLGLFSYLFQPLKIDATFPFLRDFRAATSYQGLTLMENLIGGAFWLFPILTVGLGGVFKKNVFSDKCAYRMVYLSMLIAVVIVVLDTQMAGLLTRYFNDFVWLIMLASSVTVFALYDSYDNAKRQSLISLVLILSCASLAFEFLRIFAHTEDSIMASNPVTYYTIERLIAFWM